MAYTCFDVSHDNGIAHIQLSRPEKRNSMILEFWDELPELVREIDKDGSTRVIVISSTGPHFTSGLDLGAFAGATTNKGAGQNEVHQQATAGLGFYQNVLRMQDCFTALEKARVPVLVAIQGGCIGGGVDMVTACDMRYCTADAFFTIYEINIGMTADVGTFPRILNHLPEGVVRELAYTGRRMSAAEAQSLGLVNSVYDDQDAMLEGVMATAREIASKPPMAIYGCKNIITYARDHSTEDTLDYIGIWNATMLQQSEIMEAMKAKQTGEPGAYAPLPPFRKVAG
ncbi:crotonase/enoyl-CoA hydratase family protein [Parvularcula sp. IMCC14364]|uniref:crotonase/enoyl-CoA hydratase family protein n=1 Tax=Parvularcula sp. IMCC14364 TaxID=3067902 RepID=UPI002740DEAF|nr:crotonase/enoyl-CoA hydratase family protein [Parvularcula sp. IMCC14364]